MSKTPIEADLIEAMREDDKRIAAHQEAIERLHKDKERKFLRLLDVTKDKNIRLNMDQIALYTGRTRGTIRNLLSKPGFRGIVEYDENGTATLTLEEVETLILSRAKGPTLSPAKRETVRMMARTTNMGPAQIAKTLRLSESTVLAALVEPE